MVLHLFVLLSFANQCVSGALVPPHPDSKLLFDLTDPAYNVELGSEVDGMHAMVQVVPGALAATLVNLEPCGLGLAHSHAHVDGLAFILESNPELEMGYVKDGAPVVLTDLHKGMTVQVPRGLLHWVVNKSCKEHVEFIQFFNGDDITQDRPAVEVASLPVNVLAASLGIDVAHAISNHGWQHAQLHSHALPTARHPADHIVLDQLCMKRCHPEYTKEDFTDHMHVRLHQALDVKDSKWGHGSFGKSP